ncbi:c-type cytochrome [Mucilaginibacter sp. BT774]|uniref:c-type cytochrome n=1 Tax=Mucilaginibacter sp. BT774 TaxID=3062276 RepID=UPI002675BF15|nr:c-type cytochrome [Mucilaginibacter sp. BT774]MDO3628199.1 c-type cytochrome [Mucilaginibacter sp. BT774]
MKLRKMVIIPGLLAYVVISSVAAATSTKEKVKYTNLKVLPKDISSKDLQDIMADDFEDGLGVTCGFCHANAKDGHGLDFASDEKPEKEIARAMMRMTLGINKKYFQVKHPNIGSNALTVTCTTCHKGEAFPDGDTALK